MVIDNPWTAIAYSDDDRLLISPNLEGIARINECKPGWAAARRRLEPHNLRDGNSLMAATQ